MNKGTTQLLGNPIGKRIVKGIIIIALIAIAGFFLASCGSSRYSCRPTKEKFVGYEPYKK